jgi:hypothetical protein
MTSQVSKKRVPIRELQLKITLRDSNPPIWRRVHVLTSTTLHQLHRNVQMLMEWYDYHLYEFQIRGIKYEYPHDEADGIDSTAITLGDLGFAKGERFLYVYDFGDYWEHEILVERRKMPHPQAWLPFLAAGERAGPPEDCGGIEGFQTMLQVLADPSHPDHDDTLTWVGEDYDPARFDVRAYRHALIMAYPGGKDDYRDDSDPSASSRE